MQENQSPGIKRLAGIPTGCKLYAHNPDTGDVCFFDEKGTVTALVQMHRPRTRALYRCNPAVKGVTENNGWILAKDVEVASGP